MKELSHTQDYFQEPSHFLSYVRRLFYCLHKLYKMSNPQSAVQWEDQVLFYATSSPQGQHPGRLPNFLISTQGDILNSDHRPSRGTVDLDIDEIQEMTRVFADGITG